MTRLAAPVVPLLCCALVAGCATPTLPGSAGHISEAARAPGAIPEPVQQSATLRPPTPAAKLETYSVTVHKVPVQSLLFALARDAGMNVDIHPGIEGNVTLNALDQTLPQLLSRIARQVDMRFEIEGKNLVVLPDTPVWRNYKVDYVNMARSTSSSVNIATQISTTGSGNSNSNSNANLANNQNNNGSQNNGSNQNGSANSNQSSNATPAANGGDNNSTTSVWNRSENNFWFSLEKNIRDMLRETTMNDAMDDPMHPNAQAAAPAPQMGQREAGPGAPAAAPARAAASREAASVIVNVEAGLIAVRASGRQHQKIQEFIDLVLASAKRQVLIEATIIEVRLSDEYQQGINWSRLHGGLSLEQKPVGVLPSGVAPGTSAGAFLLNYLNPTSHLGNISATIQLLESFGKVKVLSSPKISVLNNQTALLKVVDNNVFFTIKVTPAVIGSTGTITTPATYESQLETVPVGFVMSVTPQIAENDEVTLNVRPTITRIVSAVTDPNPALAAGKVVSQVPVIQARELESILKVSSGQIAVMGGLMQDSVDNARDSIPGASTLPWIGNLFSYRKENASKTELVIFIRPVVVRDASINGDYKDYRYLLPSQAPLNADPYGARPATLVPAPSTRVQSVGNPGS